MIDIDPQPLDAPWIHGRRRGTTRPEPPLQVRALDDSTYVLRQSKSLTFEAPFLFLLIGSDRALLLDTGAVGEGRPTTDAVPSGGAVGTGVGPDVADWLPAPVPTAAATSRRP